MSDRNFTVAGISTDKGVTKIRYANSLSRAKVLAKNGHTDIKLFEMPFPGAKEDAIDFLLGKDLGEVGNELVRKAAKELGFVIKDTPAKKAEPETSSTVETPAFNIDQAEEALF